MNIKKILIGGAASGIMMLATVFPAFAATTVVKAGDLDSTSSVPATVRADGLNKWFMYNDTTDVVDNTLGSFVAGPATPAFGAGSIQFTLGANPNDRKNIATYQFAGTTLSSITVMSFGTYSHSGVGGTGEAPFLNFNVDFNGSNTWQKRLVFVPSANGTVTKDVWQTWDAYNAGNALWSYSGATWPTASAGPDNGVVGIPGTTAKKWSTIVADYPGVRVLSTDSWLGIRVGEPGPTGYIGNVDFFSIATGGSTTTYDFEPSVGPPTSFGDCAGNGWKTFNNPTFTNVGKCIAYVAQHLGKTNGNINYSASFNRHSQWGVANDGKTAISAVGAFAYTDAHHDWYIVNVADLKVLGNKAWFAGKVTSASQSSWVGNWVFVKAEDNAPDKVWGSFTTQAAAESGVSTMSTPVDGPFNVTSGNLTVQ